MQNNVWYDSGPRVTYPNLYVWIIGDGATGKSIPPEWAAKMLRATKGLNVHSGGLTKTYMVKLMEASCLKQQIDQEVGRQEKKIVSPSIILHSDELAVGLGEGDFSIDLLKTLVQIYADQDHYDYGTVTHNKISLEHPLVNWVACSTPAWLARAIPPDLVTSGLIARVNTITAPFPERSRRDYKFNFDLYDKLLYDLLIITTLSGEYGLDPTAAKVRESITNKHHEERKRMRDATTRQLYGREDDHILKVAMALSASVKDDLIISASAIETATTLVNEARETSLFLYEEGSATTRMQPKLQIMRFIQKHHVVTRRNVVQLMSKKINAQDVDRIIASLLDEGAIAMIHDTKTDNSFIQWKQKQEGQNGNS